MKKIFNKKTIFTILVAITICLGWIVIAATIYRVNTIEYTPTDSSWNVSNVNETINSLYDIKKELDNIKSLGDAVSSDILSWKTAVVNGRLVTGTMKSNSGNVATGVVDSLIFTYDYEVEIGFRPVCINILVIYNGAMRSFNIYDERIDTTIHKIGSDTNATVGLPLTLESAIYDTGFRLNQGYNYGGWELHYVAFKEFPE